MEGKVKIIVRRGRKYQVEINPDGTFGKWLPKEAPTKTKKKGKKK